MKINRANFSEFYLKNLRSKLLLLDKERERISYNYIATNLVSAFLFYHFLYKKFGDIIIYPIVGIAVLTFYLYFDKFKKTYKEKIVELVFSQVFDQHTYRTVMSLTEAEYRSSFLFQGSYNEFSGADLVDGTFKGQDVRMSYLDIKYSKSSDSKSDDQIIFLGLMVIIKINTPYLAQTIVEPDETHSLLSFLSKNFDSSESVRHELVRLESIEFEKEFAVKSNDQVEARKILTPVVQEKLVKLLKKNKTPFAFSVQKNQIAVAIPRNASYFEPQYFSSIEKSHSVHDIVELFLFLEDLLKEIAFIP